MSASHGPDSKLSVPGKPSHFGRRWSEFSYSPPINLEKSRSYSLKLAEALRLRRELRWELPVESSREVQAKLLACEMPLVSKPDSAPLPAHIKGASFGWTYHTFLDYTTGEHHTALVYGDHRPGEGVSAFGEGDYVPVRLHSSSIVGDRFFGRDNTRRARLDSAIEYIVKHGRGVILYLSNDGRGHGVTAQLDAARNRYFFSEGVVREYLEGKRPRSLVQSYEMLGKSDCRDWAPAVEILKTLGIHSVQLINNSTDKLEILAKSGIPACNFAKSVGRLDPNGTSYKPGGIRHAVALRQEILKKGGPEALHELRNEMAAHCALLENDTSRPWKTVANNKQLLAAAGLPIIRNMGWAPAPTRHGDFTMVAYGDYTTGEVHRALVLGDYIGESGFNGRDILVRVHSACATNEVFHSTNCECRAELALAMEQIKGAGRGIILYLDQEGRGTGIHGKLAQLREMFQFADATAVVPRVNAAGTPVATVQAYKNAGYPPETRDFSVANAILRDLGVESVKLITNNPRKLNKVASGGFPVTAVPCLADINELPDPGLLAYELQNKRDYLGHRIPDSILNFGK